MGQLIGSYGYCNKHGPYGGTRCTLCDKEHAETLQMIWDATMPQFVGIDWGKGKSWTGATTIMTAPTEEQLRDFDFWTREAPARATHCARFPSGEIEWQKRSPDRFPQRWSERRMLWEDAGHAATGKLFARPAKPEPKGWDGEGLPPVGCECEVKAWAASWFGCTVLAHDGQIAVCRMGDDYPNGSYEGFVDVEFRPLRTQAERDAERDRFELARDLLDDLSALDINVSGKTATALAVSFMNRGWRKGDS